MLDDHGMDRLLTRAMAAEPPALPPGFDAAVLRRVRRRPLDGRRRAVLIAYAVASVLAAAWLMRGLDPLVLAAGSAVVLTTAAGAALYARHLVR